MNSASSSTSFYNELQSLLSKSTGVQRKMWATTIIERDLDLKSLSELLKCDHKTALRYLWLLSDVAIQNPNKLLINLPLLLDLLESLNPIYTTSLASYWLYVGIPQENEGRAINLLFQWLLSNNTNVTIKSRSLLVLFKLSKKYPELKNEIILCLNDQMDKHSKDFKKRASKILMQLESSPN